jgi:rhodanese-related sulfurtransferase
MNDPTIKSVTCGELYAASQSGPVDLIDVRTPEEFQDIHAAGARNIPLDAFAPRSVMSIRMTAASEPLYFICAVGARSAWACEMMMAAGYENVVNVEGGTHAWYLAGLPVERGS